MPDIREKPKYDGPKVRDAAAKLPKEVTHQIKVKTLQDAARGRDEERSAGEYATDRMERGADRAARSAVNAASRGAMMVRKKAIEKKQRAEESDLYGESGNYQEPHREAEPYPADPFYPESQAAPSVEVEPLSGPAPAQYQHPTPSTRSGQRAEPYQNPQIRQYAAEQAKARRTGTRPGTSISKANYDESPASVPRSRDGGISEPQRQLWISKAQKARQEQVKLASAPVKAEERPVKNLSQIETHFDTGDQAAGPYGASRSYNMEQIKERLSGAEKYETDVPHGSIGNMSQIETHFDKGSQAGESGVTPGTARSITQINTRQAVARQNVSHIDTKFDIKERSAAGRRIRESPARRLKVVDRAHSVKTSSAATSQAKRAIRRQTAARAQRQARQKAVKELTEKSVKVTRKTAEIGARIVKAVGASLAKGVGSLLGISGVSVLLVALLFIGAIGAIVASPMGIFFAGESKDGVSMMEAMAQINTEYNDQLEALKAGDYDDVQVMGAPPLWRDVLAVFAVKTAGADDGTDVATLDEARVELLRTVFWDMTAITSYEEIIEHEDTDPEDEEDDSYTETILHITISSKSADEMRMEYTFTAYQNDALDELLSEEFADMWTGLPFGASDDIVAVAASQIGNVGGQPYWSWYGFSYRVAWCACFVSWCADQCGYIEAGIFPRHSLVDDGIDWFRARGQWQGRNYIPSPGNIIYFDWQPNGYPDHVGIVEYCDGAYVHTIEGNTSGDVCKRNVYAVGEYDIYGYGIIMAG